MKDTKIFKHFMSNILNGLFWLLPIIAIIIILSWLYNKISSLVALGLGLVGITPQKYILLWDLLAIGLFAILLYIVGYLVRTRLADVFEYIFCKIPGYSTIKGIVGIFNSSKDGKNKVLVVAIKGFAKEGYNIGLMYSQKESIIKDHYTVTLSMSPIPNGGFMFEVHKDNIYVIDSASFDDNLNYLLSMGVKSLADIIDVEPKDVKKLTTLEDWLKQ